LLNELFTRHLATLHALVVLLGLAIYATASHTRRQRRYPSAAIAWVVSLVLLPYVALPLYLIFGSRKVVAYGRTLKAKTLPRAAHATDQSAAQSGQLAAAMGLPEIATYEQLTIHQDGGQALQCLRNMIGRATRTLDLCSFLLGRDVVGDEIAMLLIRRAQAGVQIRLLLDGIGFYLGGHPNLKRLSAAGVHVALFVSPLRSALRGRTNLRNHRKLVITDGQWMWCGGRNLAAQYFAGDPSSLRNKAAWIDLSFDLGGALVQQAQQRFEQDWTFATKGVTARLPRSGAPAPISAGVGARLVASGPDQAEDTLYTLLVSGCFMARSLAARRGIAVDLLLPRKSNHRLADIARHSALRELAAAGASIWLVPAMIHAKAVLIDNDLALVGSANLDERSLFLNYELMVAFYDPSVVQRFARWIELQRSGATHYRPRRPGLVRELVEGLVRWVAFQL